MSKIKTVGIAGTGLIGAGWAARLLIRGFDVIAYDVSPTAEAKLKAAIKVAWPSMEKLLGKPKKKGKLSFTTDLKEMASKAQFIHEAAPEREALKIKLFKDIDAIAAPDVIISSSSSGFLPTKLQSECKHPERVIIGHPFNPVYLLPLVETVPGAKTSKEAMDRAGGHRLRSRRNEYLRVHFRRRSDNICRRNWQYLEPCPRLGRRRVCRRSNHPADFQNNPFRHHNGVRHRHCLCIRAGL